jgi:hypothetical protein
MIFGAIKRTQIGPLLTVCEAAVKELKLAENLSASGCQSCMYYKGNRTGTCSKHNADVPEEFRSAGCDEWTHDDIPF